MLMMMRRPEFLMMRRPEFLMMRRLAQRRPTPPRAAPKIRIDRPLYYYFGTIFKLTISGILGGGGADRLNFPKNLQFSLI